MRALNPLFLLLAALLLGSCDSPSGPVSSGIPLGRFTSEQMVSQGGVDMRHNSAILLNSQSDGRIFDTLYAMRNGAWEPDLITTRDLNFTLVGDGYQRALEVTSTSTGIADTTIAYWYFFRRGDSLYYYRGQRFTGANTGLAGNWKSDTLDVAFNGIRYELDFSSDSVSIARHSGSDVVSGRYPYTAQKSSLAITGSPFSLGERYEVIPGWALYLTSHATRGYKVAP